MLTMSAETSATKKNVRKGLILRQAFAAALIVSVFMFVHVTPLAAAVKHTVRAGESLFLISQRYGTTVQELKAENGLKGDLILIGQTLKVPGGSMPSRSAGSAYTADDLYWLSKAVFGEARGESYTGQVAVAAVVINRLENPEFPKTIKDVIFEPKAFTAVADGQIYMDPNANAIKAAREAMAGTDPSGGALYYWNPQKATSKWIWTRSIIKRIGNHIFGI